MHVHHCEVCKQQVSACADDACLDPAHPNHGKHYCSMHHPEEEHRVEMQTAPPKFTVALAE